MSSTALHVALRTALEQPGFDDLPRGDLFALTRACRDVVARGEAALKRRAKFPTRIGPELVLRYLALPDVSSALRASTAWSKSTDAAFHAIADDKALTRSSPEESWRDLVQASVSLRWVAAGDHADDESPVPCSRGRFSSTYGHLSLGGPSVTIEHPGRDTYVLGRGLPISCAQNCAQNWRLEMSKEWDVTDGFGFAIIHTRAADSFQVQSAIIWNSSGEIYMDGRPGPEINWLTQRSLDEEVYEDNAKLEIRVRNFRFLDSILHVELWRIGTDGSESDTPERLDSTQIVVGRQDLVIAPFVRIYEGSTATLSRV
mmetsp:Transcript_8563/g.25579  ORF Transcript_8563/g.25579 Transcript_8563/m.25579 type:complete len:315 (+) Transcript_8563:336-1280(+)